MKAKALPLICKCQNGGICQEGGICKCPDGFRGPYCKIGVQPAPGAGGASTAAVIVPLFLVVIVILTAAGLYFYYRSRPG